MDLNNKLCAGNTRFVSNCTYSRYVFVFKYKQILCRWKNTFLPQEFAWIKKKLNLNECEYIVHLFVTDCITLSLWLLLILLLTLHNLFSFTCWFSAVLHFCFSLLYRWHLWILLCRSVYQNEMSTLQQIFKAFSACSPLNKLADRRNKIMLLHKTWCFTVQCTLIYKEWPTGGPLIKVEPSQNIPDGQMRFTALCFCTLTKISYKVLGRSWFKLWISRNIPPYF